MTRPRITPCLAAALAGWSALATAAPGVAVGTGIEAVVQRRAPAAHERVLEAELRDEAFRLWQASGFGADRTERAAWVVRAPAGVAWRDWPWDRRYEQTRWLGPTPAGAVAIVHTHPAVVDPRPSVTDRATAGSLGVAVYTISRSGIWKVGPDGLVTRVGDERWWSGCESRGHCREGALASVALASTESPARDETTARPLRITE
jgi:hypothetical protein